MAEDGAALLLGSLDVPFRGLSSCRSSLSSWEGLGLGVAVLVVLSFVLLSRCPGGTCVVGSGVGLVPASSGISG